MAIILQYLQFYNIHLLVKLQSRPLLMTMIWYLQFNSIHLTYTVVQALHAMPMTDTLLTVL